MNNNFIWDLIRESDFQFPNLSSQSNIWLVHITTSLASNTLLNRFNDYI